MRNFWLMRRKQKELTEKINLINQINGMYTRLAKRIANARKFAKVKP